MGYYYQTADRPPPIDEAKLMKPKKLDGLFYSHLDGDYIIPATKRLKVVLLKHQPDSIWEMSEIENGLPAPGILVLNSKERILILILECSM